jgi:cytochrome c peroxidase
MKLILVNLIIVSVVLLLSGSSCVEDSAKESVLVSNPSGLEGLAHYIPENNQMSIVKIKLGEKLFFDERLSIDGTVSCGFCHNPLLGFSDGRYKSMGIYGLRGKRNAPTIINRIFSQYQFMDGRANNIEEVVLEHIQNNDEMNHSLENLITVLNNDKMYRNEFSEVFETQVTAEGISKAIASFVRTIVSGNSPFDQFNAGNEGAISESARRGLDLFMSDELKCSECHAGENFTDEKFQNNGAGMDSENLDWGRYLQTGNEEDKGKVKTPTLRDIARSSPYMHDGSLKSLADVVDFYDQGGIPNKNLSEHIKPLNLTEFEKADLVEFLRSLTGTNVYYFGTR